MAETIRAGMIGLDTSHCGAFAERFHKKIPGSPVRVVAGYPSFSPDVESSASRVEDFKKQLSENYGLKITGSIDELLEMVDVVLIESVDGRRHLKELQAVAPSGKPTFVDKPFAASLADGKEMVKLVKEHKLPCFGCSSLRFDSALIEFNAQADKHGKVVGCDAFGPAHLEPTNPGLFWYGIHGVEILYTIMGRGCKTVSCTSTPEADMAVGVWDGSRLGTMRGIRGGKGGYGAVVLTEKQPVTMVQPKGDYYDGLCRAMIEFFRTKEPPFAIEETLEICAFIDAALRSSKEDADDVRLEL